MTTALQEIKEEDATTIRVRDRRHIFTVAALIALAAIAFFLGLGRLSLVGPDEPRFAEAAREMFATGDYITPRVAGAAAFDKPALLYWAIAGAYHLFGVNEFAARLPSALAALACLLFLYHALRRMLSEQFAGSAALVLATNFFFVGFSRAVIMDMTFTATVAVALLSLHLCLTATGRARLTYWMITTVALGLSVLAKGLIGIFLIVGIALIAGLLTRQWPRLSWRAWVAGTAIFLAIVALWYVPVTMVNGHTFIDEFIIKHHFRRFLTNRYQHPQPVWFFPAVTLAGLLPWTFFLLPAVARLRLVKPRSGEPRDTLLTLAWIWLLVPMIFFSISQSKLPSYILPAFPALAIIVGAEIERFCRGERERLLSAAAWLTALIVITVVIALPVYLHRQALLDFNAGALVYIAPLVPAIFTAILLAMSKRRMAVAAAATTVLAMVIVVTVALLPRLDDEIGLKRLSLAVAGALRPDEKMTFYQNKNYAPVFYGTGRAITSPERGEGLNSFKLDEVIAALDDEASLIVIATASNESHITEHPLLVSSPVARQGEHRALRVSLSEMGKAESEARKTRLTPTPDASAPFGVYIPTDLEDAFREMERMLAPHLIRDMQGKSEQEMVAYHDGLGRWMRNNWGLWAGSRLAKHFNQLGIFHPDDMSAVILESFWRHLHAQPLDLEARAAFYKEYWRRHREPETTRCPLDGSKLTVEGSLEGDDRNHQAEAIYVGRCKRRRHIWAYEVDKSWYQPDADLRARIDKARLFAPPQ